MMEQNASYKDVLRKSLLRTHWTLCHPSVQGMSVIAAVHGAEYEGPTWIALPEIQEALKLAGLPSELPVPNYPEREAGVFKRKYREVRISSVTYTEHAWENYPPEEAEFIGTYVECYAWAKKNYPKGGVERGRQTDGDPDNVQCYVTHTGRYIDKGEESAFFAMFDT